MRPWTGRCQRCFKKSFSSIMSMYSEALICMDCEEKERTRSDYKQAEAADLRAYADRMGSSGCADQQVKTVRDAADKLDKG